MKFYKIIKYLCSIECCQTNCCSIRCCDNECFIISCKKNNNAVSIDEEWTDMLKDDGHLFVIENEEQSSSDGESYGMEV